MIILYHPLPLCLMLEDNSETVKTKQLENLNDNSKNVFFKIFWWLTNYGILLVNKIDDQVQDDGSKQIPAGIYPFKVSNRNTRTRCEICRS